MLQRIFSPTDFLFSPRLFLFGCFYESHFLTSGVHNSDDRSIEWKKTRDGETTTVTMTIEEEKRQAQNGERIKKTEKKSGVRDGYLVLNLYESWRAIYVME